MLDQQDRDFGGQGGESGQNIAPLFLGHAGGGLVEQQHARTRGERESDLEQALLAIRERARRLVHRILEPEAPEQLLDLRDEARFPAGNAPEVAARAVALGDREAQQFRGREVGEQLIDLERPRKTATHASARRQRGDVFAFQEDRACARLDDPREQIDQRRLAGAVGTDQRLARAGLNRERDVVRCDQAAKSAHEAARLQRGSAHAASSHAAGRFSRSSSHRTRSPKRSRPTRTSTTSSAPIQNSQYSGVALDMTSLSTMKIAAPMIPP